MATETGTNSLWLKIIGIAVTAIGGLFTYSYDQRSHELAEANFLSQLDHSEKDFRHKALVYLDEKVLDPHTPLEIRLARLRLFMDNFSNTIAARRVLDALMWEAQTKPAPHRELLVTDLLSIAKATTQGQENQLPWKPARCGVKEGKLISAYLRFDGKAICDGQGQHGEEAGGHKIEIKLLQITSLKGLEKYPHAVNVEISIDRGERAQFEVSYFDQPITDNTLLPDGHRFALTLNDIKLEDREATLHVMEFPEDFMPPGYRPRLAHLHNQDHHH